ncbi:MAG: hypothetical protein QM680_04425 [Luteolibacter sp.]
MKSDFIPLIREISEECSGGAQPEAVKATGMLCSVAPVAEFAEMAETLRSDAAQELEDAKAARIKRAEDRRQKITDCIISAKASVAEVQERIAKRPPSTRKSKISRALVVSGNLSADHVHVREYSPSNWWTSRGVLKKRREIEALGLPSFRDWRFITLTYDQEKFPDGPLSAYLAGKRHMREFLYQCRKRGLWSASAKWCWKLEFQSNGWPHYHLLIERTQIFTHAQLAQIGQLWDLGRTNVERVRNDDFLYSFKYAFKPVVMDREDDELGFENEFCLPDWFLEYEGLKEITVAYKCPETGESVNYKARKPVTFARVRFWQTSKDFYTGVKRPRDITDKGQQSWGVPLPVRALANQRASKVSVVARDGLGRYAKASVVLLSICAAQLWTLAGWHAVGGNAAFLGINNAVIPTHIITQNTNQKWQLQQILNQNRLSLRRAQILQQRGETLQRC